MTNMARCGELTDRETTFARRAGDGRLFLTNVRLAWRHGWLTIPFYAPAALDVPLDSIDECEFIERETRRYGLYVQHGAERHRFGIITTRRVPPFIWWSRRDTEEWATAINHARGDLRSRAH
jgi:hypothetical protein